MKRLACIALLGVSVACHSSLSPPKPTSALVESSDAPQKRFDYPDAGIAFMYPWNWKPVPGSKSQLAVIAPDGGQLSLDVPVLPFHIPGMIPVDQVESGYGDDFKKRMP